MLCVFFLSHLHIQRKVMSPFYLFNINRIMYVCMHKVTLTLSSFLENELPRGCQLSRGFKKYELFQKLYKKRKLTNKAWVIYTAQIKKAKRYFVFSKCWAFAKEPRGRWINNSLSRWQYIAVNIEMTRTVTKNIGTSNVEVMQFKVQ